MARPALNKLIDLERTLGCLGPSEAWGGANIPAVMTPCHQGGGHWTCEALPLCRAQITAQLGQGLGLRVRQCFREGSLFLALFQYCEHLGTIGQDE